MWVAVITVLAVLAAGVAIVAALRVRAPQRSGWDPVDRRGGSVGRRWSWSRSSTKSRSWSKTVTWQEMKDELRGEPDSPQDRAPHDREL